MIGYGRFISSRKARICSVDSYPSITGMLQSIKIKSKLQNLPLFSRTSLITIYRASCPFKADTISLEFVIPTEYLRIIVKAWMLKNWSSTIRIFFGLITWQELIISTVYSFVPTRGTSTEFNWWICLSMSCSSWTSETRSCSQTSLLSIWETYWGIPPCFDFH